MIENLGGLSNSVGEDDWLSGGILGVDKLRVLGNLVENGLALIPVNSEKKPYKPFKDKDKLDLVSLIDGIRNFGSDRVAIRCGVVSGGLICIDVDSKHKDGFAEKIWSDISGLYPDIFEKLVVDKSPSGGLHFYYLLGELAGEISSCDLASRKSTSEELLVDPNRKKRCFLELKASNGSLVTCYPSLGYTRLRGNLFSELTKDEHSCLISLCLQYDEIEKVEIVKIKSNEKSQYKENETPFDEFNRSEKGAEVLEQLGWRFYRSSGKYDRYIKPGNKGNNIGGSFNRETRIYKIFTSNSDLEQKNYNPSSLLCYSLYGGDWGRLFRELVAQGFGKLQDGIEQNLIRKAIKLGIDLPSNISEEGKIKYKDGLKSKKEKYPHGEFWESDEKGNFKISREKLYFVSDELGFKLYKEKPVYINDYVVKIVDERFYFDEIKKYIGSEVSEGLKDCYEAFLQASGKFTISRLKVLDEKLILKSSKTVSFKFYSNCYIYIDKDGIEIFEYEKLNQLIWFHDKKEREFHFIESEEFRRGLYWDFIQNAIGWSQYVMKCIGYYGHDYRDEEGYWIIATEKCENPKDGGGSGKNIFCSLFELITTFKSTPASMIKFDNNLLQSWDGQRIFCLSDIPKKFEIVFFKDIVTGNAVVNKKYINEYSIAIEDMCKLLGSSNYSFDKSDPGIKRRVRALEFTDYYTNRGGVKKVTGKMFPKDWESNDLLMYDNIMIGCIQEYLKADGVIEIQEMSEGGWVKQFEQTYTHLYSFIETYIDDWIYLGKVSNDKFNADYSEFTKENNIKYTSSSQTQNKALEDYCTEKKIGLILRRKRDDGKEDGMSWKDNGKTIRGRLFGDAALGYIDAKKVKVEDLPF